MGFMFHEKFFQLKAICRYFWKGGRFNQNKLIAAHQMTFSPNQYESQHQKVNSDKYVDSKSRETCVMFIGKNLDKSLT